MKTYDFLPPPVLGYSLPFSAFSLPFSAELGPVFEFFLKKNEKWCMQVWPSENHRNPHFQVRIPKSGHLHSRAAPHDPSSGGRMAYHGLLLWTGVSGLACRSGLCGRKWNQHLPSNIGVQTDPKFVHILNLTSKSSITLHDFGSLWVRQTWGAKEKVASAQIGQDTQLMAREGNGVSFGPPKTLLSFLNISGPHTESNV